MSQAQVNEQEQMEEVKEDVLDQVAWIKKYLEVLEDVINNEGDETALKMKVGLLLDEIRQQLDNIEESIGINIQTSDLSGNLIYEPVYNIDTLIEDLMTGYSFVSRYLLYVYNEDEEEMELYVYDGSKYKKPIRYDYSKQDLVIEDKEAVELDNEIEEVMDKYGDEIAKFSERHGLSTYLADFDLALRIVASRRGYRVLKFKVDNATAWVVYKPVVDP